MILIAKKGTAFEQTVKKMYDRMVEGIVGGHDLVEKAVGVRPKDTIHVYHWGIILKLIPEFVFDEECGKRINPKYLRKKKGLKDHWVPALKHKEGRELDAAFRKYSKDHIVTDEPLHEFGIYMEDKANGISYSIHLFHDGSDRYMLICSDRILSAFDKKKLADDQLNIKY